MQAMNLKTPLTVEYDSADAAVAEEIRFLKSRNSESRLMFVDTAAKGKNGRDNGASPNGMDGKLVVSDAADHEYTGIEALHAAHSAIGLGAWFEMCRLAGFLSVGTGIRPKN